MLVRVCRGLIVGTGKDVRRLIKNLSCRGVKIDYVPDRIGDFEGLRVYMNGKIFFEDNFSILKLVAFTPIGAEGQDKAYDALSGIPGEYMGWYNKKLYKRLARNDSDKASKYYGFKWDAFFM